MSNADPESQSLIFQFILLIVLTFINAFLAAAEISVVSINKNRVEQKADEGDVKSKKLLTILRDPTNFLSTIQVGITLVNILSGASLANTLSSRLAPSISVVTGFIADSLPILNFLDKPKTIAYIIIVALLTYISIVFGELYPKRIAMNKSEEVAQYTSGTVRFIGKIARPFVWLLSASTEMLSRLTPMKFDDEDSKMTRDEMRYMLETEGVLDVDELEMLQGVFSLDTKVAREVMVPRTDAFMVDINDEGKDNVELILSENFSRIPVYDDDKDKVIGIIHTKNLLKYAHQYGFDKVDLKKIIQEPLFVPETIFVDDLLYELKKTQNQMAILLDEYGGVVGLATLEDLLEEIVGEIDDESDEVEKLYSKIGENEYLVQGRMMIEEFNEIFGTHLQMNDVDTMAGYLITALGTIPDEGEKLTFDVENLTLISESMEGTRVVELRVIFHEVEESEEIIPE